MGCPKEFRDGKRIRRILRVAVWSDVDKDNLPSNAAFRADVEAWCQRLEDDTGGTMKACIVRNRVSTNPNEK